MTMTKEERHNQLDRVKAARVGLTTFGDQLEAIRKAFEVSQETGMAEAVFVIHARIAEQARKLRDIQLQLEE
jgi:hypothetical protein